MSRPRRLAASSAEERAFRAVEPERYPAPARDGAGGGSAIRCGAPCWAGFTSRAN